MSKLLDHRDGRCVVGPAHQSARPTSRPFSLSVGLTWVVTGLRVVVLDRGGAGKSTFCRARSPSTGVPAIELDAYYWDDALQPLPVDEWTDRQDVLLAGEEWIADGDLGPSQTQAVIDAGVPQLAIASSVGAYSPGPKNRAVKEDWPTGGVATSYYSRHKVEVERLLDEMQDTAPDLLISRMRPGLIFQAGAASEIARYFLGPLIPARLLGHLRLPALPIPRQLCFQAVHADDVAAAFRTVLEQRAAGPFNVAADPPLAPGDLARALGARRAIGLPLPVLRAAADLSWRAHLQPTAPGWLDMAAAVPIMSTERIRSLGWKPAIESRSALAELVDGMRRGSGDETYPALVKRAEDRGGT